MSSQPIWITTAGSLGTIAKGSFYKVPLLAKEPDGSKLYFRVVAGALPSGIECTTDGVIQGVPTNTVKTSDEASVVGNTVTSKFAVRAYTIVAVNGVDHVNRLADQTFTLTVAGQSQISWITPAGSIGRYNDGALLIPGVQLKYASSLSSVTTAISLVSGELPPGLTLSNSGVISGFIELNLSSGAILGGFSRNTQGFDDYGFDFDTITKSYTYQFTLQLTDGKSYAQRQFSIETISLPDYRASNDQITTDSTLYLASNSAIEAPVLLNAEGSLGTIPNDTFYAYQFTGTDIEGNLLGYSGENLPPGLTINSSNGWLTGYLPGLQLTDITYNFGISAYQFYNPTVASKFYSYSLTVAGPVSSGVTWLSDSNLGTIANGDVSRFYVKAKPITAMALKYTLASGSDSTLPQGLTLLSTGEIVGRTSFNAFTFDGGVTSFDNASTTVDSVYTFTVNATSIGNFINVNKTFTITVNKKYSVPYNNLYVTCLPPAENRDLINQIIDDVTLFPPDLLYRQADRNFGLSSNKITYGHAYGLNNTYLEQYVKALQLNHYNKTLLLGTVKTAQARDPITKEVVYEVVYSEIIDDLVNKSGESVSKKLVLPYPTKNNNVNIVDEIVYPNSLDNMRHQVIDVVGQESNMLPLWMLSPQSDGRVLGFTPAWVIAYTVPGASSQIAYSVNKQFGDLLNLIEFKVDRYEIDTTMTHNWQSTPLGLTAVTFDRQGIFATPASKITTFDGKSLQFTDPADTDINSDKYDTYLLFPRRVINGKVAQSTGMWVNTETDFVGWFNDDGSPVNWIGNN